MLPAPVPAAFPPFLPISKAKSSVASHTAKHLDPRIPYPTPDPGTLVAKDHPPRESDASIPLVTPSSHSDGSAVPRGGRKAGGDPGEQLSDSQKLKDSRKLSHCSVPQFPRLSSGLYFRARSCSVGSQNPLPVQHPPPPPHH